MAADGLPSIAEMLAANAAYDAARDHALRVIAGTLTLLEEEFGHFSFQGGGFWEYIRDETYRLSPRTPSTRKPKRRIPYPTRRRIFERDAYRCVKCGSGTNLTIDHRFPESKGGGDEDENLQTMCRLCNGRKGTKIE